MQRTIIFLLVFNKQSSTSDTVLVICREIHPKEKTLSVTKGLSLLCCHQPQQLFVFGGLASVEFNPDSRVKMFLLRLWNAIWTNATCIFPLLSTHFTHEKTMKIQCRCWTAMENIQLLPRHNNMLGFLAASQLLTKQGAVIG